MNPRSFRVPQTQREIYPPSVLSVRSPPFLSVDLLFGHHKPRKYRRMGCSEPRTDCSSIMTTRQRYC